MFVIHQTGVYLHIVSGVVALLLFWIPVFARKGSDIHKRIGRYFALLMYMVGISGIVLSVMDLLLPQQLHTGNNADAVRGRAVFLLSLSLLVLTTTRHGWLTITFKNDRTPLRHPLQLWLVALVLASGIVLLLQGLTDSNIVYIIFAALEIIVSAGFLRYTFKKSTLPREWWTEHLGALIASGIAAYTAFAVVGAASLLGSLYGQWPWLVVLTWVGPGVLGGVAIAVVSRHYRRKFARHQAPGTS